MCNPMKGKHVHFFKNKTRVPRINRISNWRSSHVLCRHEKCHAMVSTRVSLPRAKADKPKAMTLLLAYLISEIRCAREAFEGIEKPARRFVFRRRASTNGCNG